MRSTEFPFAVYAAAATAFALVAAILLTSLPAGAAANEPAPGNTQSLLIDQGSRATSPPPDSQADQQADSRGLRPSWADWIANPPVHFDVVDELAALESLQVALSEVGDGGSYVWHRGHGRLNGVVQPTASFRDQRGQICRHFVVMLTSGLRTKRYQSIACRMASGIWQIDG
ncbi:MAG: hypothetical protein NW205_05810 [Hyphomicrobiaceae bacterium]|nr:hypothetical protein [Hyphomicrobiaceae bacterium]